MAAKKLDINPVFNHRKSIALVDTAEDLVDSLDNLSVCLKHIEERHTQGKDQKSTSTSSENSLYEKLRENLEIARDLTDTLKREKWRLSRREMSIELRKDELEEYKSHLKRDMTDMNQTVDVLSVRIVQLENNLCEAQELQENTEAERNELSVDLKVSNTKITEMETKLTELMEEIRNLKSQRKDSVLRMQHEELENEKEILLIENQRLKEIIREKDDNEQKESESNSNSHKQNQICILCQKNMSSSVPSSPTSPTVTQLTEVAYV
ncbi:hypothetical protein ACF0H5_002784 [Mactra antiquata]